MSARGEGTVERVQCSGFREREGEEGSGFRKDGKARESKNNFLSKCP
jgi:hypothetical protein